MNESSRSWARRQPSHATHVIIQHASGGTLQEPLVFPSHRRSDRPRARDLKDVTVIRLAAEAQNSIFRAAVPF